MNAATEVAADCKKCSDHYAAKPGTVSYLTTCDLYEAIARLARIVEKLVNENDELKLQKRKDRTRKVK